MVCRLGGWLLLMSVGLLPDGAVRAQDGTFERLTLRGGVTYNVNRELLHAYWQPGVGVEASITSPFYLGIAEMGGALLYYDAAREKLDAFWGVPLYVGWGLRVPLLPRLYVGATGHLGAFVMAFQRAPPGRSVENELMLGGRARLAYRLSAGWALTLGSSYHRVFTHERIDLWYVSLGLSRRFRTPDWLVEFLK